MLGVANLLYDNRSKSDKHCFKFHHEVTKHLSAFYAGPPLQPTISLQVNVFFRYHQYIVETNYNKTTSFTCENINITFNVSSLCELKKLNKGRKENGVDILIYLYGKRITPPLTARHVYIDKRYLRAYHSCESDVNRASLTQNVGTSYLWYITC